MPTDLRAVVVRSAVFVALLGILVRLLPASAKILPGTGAMEPLQFLLHFSPQIIFPVGSLPARSVLSPLALFGYWILAAAAFGHLTRRSSVASSVPLGIAGIALGTVFLWVILAACGAGLRPEGP